MAFVTQNLFLISIALISGFALLLPLLREGSPGYRVTPGQAVMLLNRQNAHMIDVREASELESGRIANAMHIPAAELATRCAELGKNKKRPIILVCATGARSAKGVETVRKAGFEQVFNLEGGIKGWVDAGQSLISSKKA